MTGAGYIRCSMVLMIWLLLAGCAREPRPIVAEPLEQHDLQHDQQSCEKFARQYGVVDMAPVMPGSSQTEFPDGQRQVQLYESCMLKKGYQF